MLPGEALESRREVGVEPDGRTAPAKSCCGRSRPVEGQLEQGRRAGQGLAPVVGLRRSRSPESHCALPGGIVRVLDLKRRQGILAALEEGGVERAELTHQHAHRPAVGDDVVQGEEEDVILLAQTDETGPRQRPRCKIEGRLGCLDADPGQLRLGVGGLAKIVQHERQASARIKQPHFRPAFAGEEHRAQAFMTREQRIEAGLQGPGIQRPAQAKPRRHVVGDAVRIELGEEPQTLLGEGQRQRRLARDVAMGVQVRMARRKTGTEYLRSRFMRSRRRSRFSARALRRDTEIEACRRSTQISTP